MEEQNIGINERIVRIVGGGVLFSLPSLGQKPTGDI